MKVYKLIEDPVEGEIVQFLGVYVTRWRPEWGEPAVAFIENDEVNAMLSKVSRRISEINDMIGRLTIDTPPRGSVDYHCNATALERLEKELIFLRNLVEATDE